jgi:phage/plasmid-like protein (TIGR03299 family)
MTITPTHADTPEALSMSDMQFRTQLVNSISQEFAREKQLLKPGRFQDRGYSVNPLAAQAGGTVVPQDATPRQAFQMAGADFRVAQTPVFFATPDSILDRVMDESPDHCAITRCDTGALLGIMGKGYTPVQNDSLIQLFEYLREDVEIDNIVSIRDGRKVFVTASCNIEGEVTEGDKVRRYLHAFNSFDGSSAFGVFFSDVRLVCANQLRYLSGKGARKAQHADAGLVMRHTKSVEQFAKSLPALINLEQQKFSRDLEALKPLTTLKLNEEMARHILESTYSDVLARPITDKDTKVKRERKLSDLPQIATIRSHYSGNTGFGIEPGSVWAMFQAISQFETHDAGRSKDEIERARTRLESLWGGQGAERISRAREACMELV